MELKVSILPKSTFELDVTISSIEVKEEYSHVLASFQQNLELPGFRKGKAPLNLIAQNIRPEKLNQEALSHILDHYFPRILKEANLMPITSPKINIEEFTPEHTLKLKITIVTSPPLEIKDYQKTKVKKPEPVKIAEKRLDEMLGKVFENWSKHSSKKEKTEVIYSARGDILVGANPSTGSVPDDTFAQSIGAKDLSDLREKIRIELEVTEKALKEKDFENKVIEENLKKLKVEVPPALVEDELNAMIERVHLKIANIGGSFEDFLKEQGKTAIQLREYWKEKAEKNVKTAFMLDKIAELENITLTDAEIERLLRTHQHDHSPEEIEKEKTYYSFVLRQSKALTFLKESAVK